MEQSIPISQQNNPRNVLTILSIIEFWDVFSFFGTVSILVLYSTKIFLFSDQFSYTIYGVYLTLLCSLPVIGGLLADKFFGLFSSIIFGLLLLIFGNVFLTVQNVNFLYFGLAATIFGTSFCKTACSSFVGELYSKCSSQKDKAYTFFYSVMNCGAIAGPIAYGIVANFFGLHASFFCSVIGLSLCLFFVVIKKNYLQAWIQPQFPNFKKNRVLANFLFLVLFLAITACFYFIKDFEKFLFALMAMVSFFLVRLWRTMDKSGRKNLFGILILILFCTFFFLASLQVGSSLTLFVDRFVNRHLFRWLIPTSFFAALDPLFLVLSAPIFTMFWSKLEEKKKDPTATLKLIVGLIIGGGGFGFFWLSARLSSFGDHYFALISLILGYLLIGAGEICLTPSMLSAISKYSPSNLTNTMMGAWYLSMALAGYLGSFIDKIGSRALIVHAGYATSINQFSKIFLVVISTTVISAGILLAFYRFVESLFSSRELLH